MYALIYLHYIVNCFVVGCYHRYAILLIAACYTTLNLFRDGGRFSSCAMFFRWTIIERLFLFCQKKKKRRPQVIRPSLYISVYNFIPLVFTKAPLVFREQGTCCRLPSRRKLG